MKVIRINTASQDSREEPVSEEFRNLGGRAFTSHWVCRYVDPECDPLGKKNQLVIAPGLGPDTDRLPEIFSEDVNPSSGTSFDFSASELDAIEYH